jgi:hypothetical protein
MDMCCCTSSISLQEQGRNNKDQGKNGVGVLEQCCSGWLWDSWMVGGRDVHIPALPAESHVSEFAFHVETIPRKVKNIRKSVVRPVGVRIEWWVNTIYLHLMRAQNWNLSWARSNYAYSRQALYQLFPNSLLTLYQLFINSSSAFHPKLSYLGNIALYSSLSSTSIVLTQLDAVHTFLSSPPTCRASKNSLSLGNPI